jgi:TDG/mug DNA glycosylase family protein
MPPLGRRPTPDDLLAAKGRRIPDVIAHDLDVLFCGINPSLYSAAVGHHFARPGNRFWKTLHRAGFTPRQFTPEEDRLLLGLGLGLTNVFWEASATAAELTPANYEAGAGALRRKLARYRPRVIAFLGITAYRLVSGNPSAEIGAQAESIAGSRVWALPNPSGLNAHYQLASLIDVYAALAREQGFSRR